MCRRDARQGLIQHRRRLSKSLCHRALAAEPKEYSHRTNRRPQRTIFSPRFWEFMLGSLLVFFVMYAVKARPTDTNGATEIVGTVVDIELETGRFFLERDGAITMFRDHPLAMQDLQIQKPLRFEVMDSEAIEAWRWHPMLSLNRVPESWESGIVSGRVQKIDLPGAVFWLDSEIIYAHPAQLSALAEDTNLQVTYAERNGTKWLLWPEANPAGQGRPAGLFSQDAIPAGPGMSIRASESTPFTRSSLPTPSTKKQDGADAGPLGVGAWGPRKRPTEEMEAAP